MATDATAASLGRRPGAGSWGTALAALIARHGHRVVLWGRDAAVVEGDRRATRTHYLPASRCRSCCAPAPTSPPRCATRTWCWWWCPRTRSPKPCARWRRCGPAEAGVAWATKGFEPGSGRFLHEVAGEVLGEGVPLAVVTGTSFAKEVAQGLPTALTVHSDDGAFAQLVADVLHGPAFRAYTGDDMRGAELGGAMKNVLAVATGVADGMRLGLNARRAHHPRPQRDAAAQPGHRRATGNPDGTRRPRRSGAHLHRRPVAQPPPRPRAPGAGRRWTTRCARSARWSNRCRPRTR